MNSQYNLLPYNALQYNVTTAIEFIIAHAITGVDATVTKSYSTSKVDSAVLTDILAKAITDKRLVETIRQNEWFTAKNNPQSDPWS